MNKNFFLVTNNNEIQCVAKDVNKNVPYFHKKYSIVEQKILENCKSKDDFFYINEENYKDYINDLEVESFFDEIFCSDKILLPYQYKFLFLLAISEQGYNFGQYRIMSHLIKLGYKQNDFILFPLYINKNSYLYDKKKLKEILQTYQNQIYVCETSYIGWENQIQEINLYIKSISNSIILTGGPLTSSHLEFCLNKLNTDVVLTGHGEYVIEAFLKEVLIQKTQLPNVNIPEVFYVGNFSNLKPVTRINKYIELLYWDMELLARLYEIVPIINLFTSEECKGNCIFCYRESYHNCNSIGKTEFIKRIKEIKNYHGFSKYDRIYLRFFDDDFFAPQDRNSDFLEELLKNLDDKFSIFELTFSIRSLYRLYLKEGNKIFETLKKMNLKRVTIGVDGFNDNDLKYLRKGYKFNKVIDITDKLNQYKISTLMYAILTTYETSYIDLFNSLTNMTKLVIKGNMYIGPTITPSIYVQNANPKLYPQFTSNKIKYLEVESFHKKTTNVIVDAYDIIMSARILSKDNIVRKTLNIIGTPSTKESAYVLPLICAYMKVCAEECNMLSELFDRSIKHNIEIKRNELFKEITKLESYNDKFQNDVEQINFLNHYFYIEREIELTDYYMNLNAKDIESKIDSIFRLVKEYYELYQKYQGHENDSYNSVLCNNVIRLLILPLKVFYTELKAEYDRLRIANEICNRKCIIYENEYDAFNNFIKLGE